MRLDRGAPVALLASLLAAALQSPAIAQAPDYPGVIRSPADQITLRVISQDELDRYLVVLEGLIDAGVDAQSELGVDPNRPGAGAVGIRYSEKIQSLVSNQGFDEHTFGDVHQNVMRAYVAEGMAAHQGEIDAARAEQEKAMAQMRQSLSPEQAAAMMQAMSNATAMSQTYSNVPPENVALVKSNKARIDAVFEEAKTAKQAK